MCGSGVGNAYGVLLLVATAAEAAVGMLVVLETGNRGVAQTLSNLARC